VQEDAILESSIWKISTGADAHESLFRQGISFARKLKESHYTGVECDERWGVWLPTSRLQRASSASRMFRPSRFLQQEKGYQGHHQRQSNTDSERDVWRDPEANERLSQRAEHDG
jgi:hypothetical protein